MSRIKRSAQYFDEDPDDDDYGARSPERKKPKKSSKNRAQKPKSKRKSYGHDSDTEEDEEDEDDVDESHEEIDDSQVSSPVSLNPQTGRPARKATKNLTTYEESESDEDDMITAAQITDDQPSDHGQGQSSLARGTRTRTRSHHPITGRPSLIVTLKGQSLGARGRSTRGRALSQLSDAMLLGGQPRRSSRISQSEDEPLVSLTTSGRHERIERPASATPEPTARRRQSRGGKRAPNTSAILEASEEDHTESKEGIVQDQGKEEEAAMFAPELELEREESEGLPDQDLSDRVFIAESVHGDAPEQDDEEEEEGPVNRRRPTRSGTELRPETTSGEPRRKLRRQTANDEDASDFEPPGEEPEDDDLSVSDASNRKESQRSEASSNGRRSGRIAQKRATQRGAIASEATGDEAEEVLGELADLQASQREHRRKRRRSPEGISYEAPRRRARADRLDYTIRPEMWPTGEEDDQPIAQSLKVPRGVKSGAAYRSIWNTQGPFGFAGGPPPSLRTPGALAGGADSDSSEDEVQQPRGVRSIGGTIGMTPTSTTAPIPMFPQFNDPAVQGSTSGPANLGKITNKKALADADPLGIDQNVNFSGVGGLKSHIDQLKEMVVLPLLYPEIFAQFHVTPPRGVLFHGPPGTGKTLLARALANSVSSQGKKVTFYMRKGADTLSKYVGEAERQLRLLFEDARKNQPSIIFFDEIDGLAPVRSSKQDQIHATIVTTMLALMDGMDGRGQVIVIGATNRPDTVDSALRRPGRFDREFYFPLPDVTARRAIIDIHTAGWVPPLTQDFRDQLAFLTNGYGGADLRALCTEAALNAVQGTYPQIYQSTEKLLIDPTTIKVLAKDFMISVNNMIPSSQRATGSSAIPLDPRMEPLLNHHVKSISALLDDILPNTKKLSALEEAEYDDRDDNVGFEREMMQQDFDQARVFRPRLLIYGHEGMGQQAIGKAILHKFERFHVQNFDLPVLFADSARTPQAAVVQLFKEARQHKPSVIYIPNIELWYETVEPVVIKVFCKELQSLSPSDPVLLLATLDLNQNQIDPDPDLLRDLFGFTSKGHYKLERPNESQRYGFFSKVISLVKTAPNDFPHPENRKKRKIVELRKAPAAPQTLAKALTKEQLRAQKRADRAVLNMLKIKLGLIMDQLKNSFKIFRRPPIEQDVISYLYDALDPNMITTDLPEDQQNEFVRPYVVDKDMKGVGVIRETATGKIYYNLELVTIERRLSNGYYKRPKDFVADIKRLNKDAKTLGDSDKILKSNLMLANVEVDVQTIFDITEPGLTAECENVYQRELEREKQQQADIRKALGRGLEPPRSTHNVPPHDSGTTVESLGPVVLGQVVPGRPPVPILDPLDQFRQTPFSEGLSNGNAHDANADMSGVARHQGDGDAHMTNSSGEYDVDQGRDHLGPNPRNSHSQLSQNAAITPMAPGSQARDYHNSASTTTEGQKTSKSRSSGHNTQSTNGVGGWLEQPNLTLEIAGASQVPDTQVDNDDAPGPPPPFSSSQPSQLSQASPPQPTASPMGPPAVNHHLASIPSLLNSPQAGPDSGPAPPKPMLIIDDGFLKEGHEAFVKKTSGLNVEQLVQLNARLMDTIWKKRGEWNRTKVMAAVVTTFNETIEEIENMQSILLPSQPSQEKSGSEHHDHAWGQRESWQGSV